MSPIRGLLVLFWAAAFPGAVAQAEVPQSEPGQQLAAELVVLAGDTRRLRDEKAGPLETLGLEKRLLAGVASLPLTMRRAGADARGVEALRQAIGARDWLTLAAALETLKRRHPFDARPFLVASGSEAAAQAGRRGRQIHREACAACHDVASAADTLLPAKILAAQLRSMPREEFAARLWLGVRGDRTTSYANPFSRAELAAMIAWYDSQR